MSFKVPTDIARLSDAELADLIAEGSGEFETLLGLDTPSDQDVAEAERISPLIRQCQAEVERRTTAASSRAERMNALRTAHSSDTEPEPSPGDPEPEPQPDEPPSEGTTDNLRVLYAEDLVQAGDESDDAFARRQARYPHIGGSRRGSPRVINSGTPGPGGMGTGAGTGASVQVITDAPDPVVANGNQVEVLPRVPRPQRPQRVDGDLIITASADVPDFATGSRVEGITQIAQMAVNRMRGFPTPNGDPNGQMHQYGLCTLRPTFSDDLICGRQDDDYTVITRAASEARLPGGSLVAAGGWCAPSEVLYALCEAETTEGLVSLPEVQVTRGGIRYTSGPDFAAIYANTGFCFTEAEIIGGATKPCYEVPCPPFTETRLDACGTCIKVPILTNAAYPELVQRVIRGALVAFQHQLNARLLAQMETILGAATTVAAKGTTFGDTLAALELTADALRYRYRLSPRETMEVIAPVWFQGAIQADLANRMGMDNPWDVTDDIIDRALANRLIHIQWVYGWQDLIPLQAGSSPCITDYPATAKLMIYPAGTFVKGVADVINLNAVYDAASLAQNLFTGLFMEQGILLAHTCFQGCVLEIPICNAGRTGANDLACGAVTP